MALLCVVAGLAVPAAASACGDSRTAGPERSGSGGKAPLAIGDSTMLLSVNELGRRGFRANARGCRQWPEGMGVIRQAKANGGLPSFVVIHLGANADISKGAIKQAMRLVGRKTTLGLVTPRELGGGSGSDADNVREMGRRYPDRIIVIDWVKRSAGHGEWFAPDGLHIGTNAIDPYVDLIAAAVPEPTLRPVRRQDCGAALAGSRVVRDLGAWGVDCGAARRIARQIARRGVKGKRERIGKWRCRDRAIERGFASFECSAKRSPRRVQFKLADASPSAERTTVGAVVPEQGPGRLTLDASRDPAASDLTLLRGSDDVLWISDRAGNPIVNGAGELCDRPAPSVLRCRGDRLDGASLHSIRIGPGDDLRFGPKRCGPALVRAGVGGILARGRPGAPARVWGSPGADLIALRGSGNVDGCDGADQIVLAPSDGETGTGSGGAGSDDLVGLARTRLAGGAGNDSIELARGGTATGDAGDDALVKSGRGSAKLIGGGGADRLGCSTAFVISNACGRGRTSLRGGDGRDSAFAGYRSKCSRFVCILKPTGKTRIACGRGRDSARAPKKARLSSCNRVERMPARVGRFKH